MAGEERRYRAFISYSHRDRRFAKWLHRKLETYRLPRALASTASTGHSRNPLSPVFLDREELASSTSLSASVVRALQASAALVVVCSPAAAQPRWVNEELGQFRRQHPDRPVFAIACEGDPGADPLTDPESAAIPLNLLLANLDDPAGELVEPLAVDARRERQASCAAQANGRSAGTPLRSPAAAGSPAAQEAAVADEIIIDRAGTGGRPVRHGCVC